MSIAKFGIMPRMLRQQRAFEWCRRAFGVSVAENRPERAARFLEEAIELAQVVGLPEEAAARLVRHIYSRPVGEIRQEVGGVSVTLLILCEQLGINADWEEAKELARVVAKTAQDPEHFAHRLDAKAAAGVGIPSAL
jgi:hypothetical protein